ncbi:competence protein CoiA family protein [Lentilactobacillus kisonensis]|uniref:Competence protein CoiA-like N-terminal domain-containing protein n=1 Tax=Lentilactobacillus kisonensis F0435 TaxID=797516 RepID=H1LCT3_9LACO|nr:competence protein CoiA family protein [Lentilactobacillus kisonensis]EHO53812.1 hypothetical protein HMPREF9104_00397 [Lentilactobacillus kisonensis F0435]
MLVAMANNKLIMASAVMGDVGPFICPCCRLPVIYKHGNYRIPHFSHKQSKIRSS